LRPRLEYHVFDLPHIQDQFQFKVASIHDLENSFKQFPHLKNVDYSIAADEVEMKLQHADAVARGYEGLMIRNTTGVYESGKRSADLQKYKTFMDAEFKILAVNPDKNGLAVFTVQNIYADNTFEVIMGSHEERLYQMQHPEQFIGEWMNIQFQTLYKKTRLPQFPTGKGIRKCNAKGEPLV
jgi:DNA ligase-1